MPTQFARVTAEMRDSFEQRWREIDQRYPHFSEPPEGMSLAEHWKNVASMRRWAREELRRELVQAVRLGHEKGMYPIPV